jgi:hypothetical protein
LNGRFDPLRSRRPNSRQLERLSPYLLYRLARLVGQLKGCEAENSEKGEEFDVVRAEERGEMPARALARGEVSSSAVVWFVTVVATCVRSWERRRVGRAERYGGTGGPAGVVPMVQRALLSRPSESLAEQRCRLKRKLLLSFLSFLVVALPPSHYLRLLHHTLQLEASSSVLSSRTSRPHLYGSRSCRAGHEERWRLDSTHREIVLSV